MGGTNFMLQWPTADGRVTRPYDAVTGLIGLAAPAGTPVKSGAPGIVIMADADTVQIKSGLYSVIYDNLRQIRVQLGDDVSAGDLLGESAGPEIRLSIHQTIDPTPLLMAAPPPAVAPAAPPAPVPAPVPAGGVATTKWYVTPVQSGLRIREKPVDGNPIGQAGIGDILEVLDSPAVARSRLGVEGQWVNVRTLFGVTGFSAAQFLREYTGPITTPAPLPPMLGVTGMNLDPHNPLGHPAPERLKGLGWIRVKFNVSYNPDNNSFGNTDVNATFNRMRPFLKPYTDAGLKVLMVFTHQLFGEGAGYHWPSMDSGRWNEFIPRYADFAKRTAALFAGLGLVHAYQIWNEQDTDPAVARAAVPIPAGDYGNMLTQTIRAIRSVDSSTPILTGGHVGGPDRGSAYARATLSAMPPDVRPDGIATHPYGRGVSGHPFSNWGPLDEEIRKYAAVMPGRPLWITEWGVLDRQGDMGVVNDVASYAQGFINIIKSQFSGQIAAAIWYAWADGMDNGYGLVGRDDQPKQPLCQQFLTL